MVAIKQILLALVSLSTLRVTLGGPLVPKQVVSEPENAFDLGSVDECIVPSSEQLPECHSHIDYAVPAAFLVPTARGIKEKLVLGAVERARSREESSNGNVEACSETVRQYECRLQFPKCTENSVQFTNNEEECTTALTEACSSLEFYEGSCGPNVNVSRSTCTSVSTTSTGTYCQELMGWSDWHVTEWAAVLLEEAEADIDSFDEFIPSNYRSVCTPLYSQVRCGSVGSCWDHGTRMELNATREVCEALFNCIPEYLRDNIANELDCSLFPSIADKPSTNPTDITDPLPDTDSTQSTTESTQEPTVTTSREPPSVKFPQSDSFSSSSTVTSVQRLLLVSLVLVYAIMLYV